MDSIKKEFIDPETAKGFFFKYVDPLLPFDCYDWLEERGFFKAPASSHHHGAFSGGLWYHSFNVMDILNQLTIKNELKWERKESPFIVGLFHDLCKIDQYKHPVIDFVDAPNIEDTSRYVYNEDKLFTGHGEKSVMLLSTLTKLTEEEVACIRYHMGSFSAFEEERKMYGTAVESYPNVLWTHHADMLASHVLEPKTEKRR